MRSSAPKARSDFAHHPRRLFAIDLDDAIQRPTRGAG
jgi:hypothetical protein